MPAPFRGALGFVFPLLAACALSAQTPSLTLSTESRSLQPGELIVVTVKSGGGVDAVKVHAFGAAVDAAPTAPDAWQALVGIDLDQAPGVYELAAEAGAAGGAVRRAEKIEVRAKRFPTRTLRVAPRYVDPSAEELARIQEDARFQRRVYDNPARSRLWEGPFVRPVPHQANSRFGSRSIFNGEPRSPHSGTDFLSPSGTPVKAPNGGRIVGARDLYFSGNSVIIDHGLGVFSTFAHLSQIDVREGEVVKAGDVVGLVGATGRVTGAHLHWSLRVAGARVDPLALLALLGED